MLLLLPLTALPGVRLAVHLRIRTLPSLSSRVHDAAQRAQLAEPLRAAASCLAAGGRRRLMGQAPQPDGAVCGARDQRRLMGERLPRPHIVATCRSGADEAHAEGGFVGQHLGAPDGGGVGEEAADAGDL